jgi:hypothetical protein
VTPEIRITFIRGKCDEDDHLLLIDWIRNMLDPGGEALQSI